jgi:hypothetical protein
MRSQARTGGTALFAALLVLGLAGCFGSGENDELTTYVVCVDSTHSTDEVRSDYMPDLVAVAERGVMTGAHLYADACGSNATGTVQWRIDKVLRPRQALTGILKEKSATTRAEKMRQEFEAVLAKNSPHAGTPLAKILGVVARECAANSGPCEAFVLTDGVWWDNLLRITDGVTPDEEQAYVERFAPLLDGLKGAKVSFAGVGLGTEVIGEQRLAEAQKVAEALVKAAGGRVVFWDVKLNANGKEA